MSGQKFFCSIKVVVKKYFISAKEKLLSDLEWVQTSATIADKVNHFCVNIVLTQNLLRLLLHLMMISQKHTKPENLNVPGKSHLKRQITHEKVEAENNPLNKFFF